MNPTTKAALFTQWARLIRCLDEAQMAASDLSALLAEGGVPPGLLDGTCETTAADLIDDSGAIDWHLGLIVDSLVADAPAEVVSAARPDTDDSETPAS